MTNNPSGAIPKLSEDTQNPSQNQFESILEKMVPEPATIWTARCFFTACWRHLTDLGSHLGPSWIPKGSQNHHFGTSSWKNDENESPKTRTPKTWSCNRKMILKWMVWEVKVSVWQVTCCKVRSSRCHTILRKSMPKWIPKKIKIGAQNALRSDFGNWEACY